MTGEQAAAAFVQDFAGKWVWPAMYEQPKRRRGCRSLRYALLLAALRQLRVRYSSSRIWKGAIAPDHDRQALIMMQGAPAPLKAAAMCGFVKGNGMQVATAPGKRLWCKAAVVNRTCIPTPCQTL